MHPAIRGLKYMSASFIAARVVSVHRLGSSVESQPGGMNRCKTDSIGRGCVTRAPLPLV